nr:iron-sulfur cluster assembly scaffold protein [Halovenus salina]
MLSDPTVRKSSEETVCGDDGEFYVDIGPGGTIEQLAFESQSCAVSQAVASILSEHLKGMHLEEVAELDAIESLLDGQFPPLRRDCVLGPEDVIREAAREYVDRPRTTH